MGSGYRKIYRLAGIIMSVILVLAGPALLAQRDNAAKWDVIKLKVPIYQEGHDYPIVILYGEAAKPIGLRYEVKGVKLDWIGCNLSDIRGTVETPSAVYDQTSKTVLGNEKITYRSKEIDINGVGFDIDQEKQIIHIRSEVEVILKSDLSSTKQLREVKGDKKKGGALSLTPTTEKGKAEEQDANSKFKQLLNEISVKSNNTKEQKK